MQDVIEFGVIPELASRSTRIINVRPLTLADYKYLIAEHAGSPMKKLERVYGRKFNLSKRKMYEIAKNAFDSGLGIRNVTAQLQQIMDKMIFDDFSGDEEKPEKPKRSSKKGTGKGEGHVL